MVNQKERRIYDRQALERQLIQANKQATGGFVMGIFLTGLAGIGVSALYMLSQNLVPQAPVRQDTALESGKVPSLQPFNPQVTFIPSPSLPTR